VGQNVVIEFRSAEGSVDRFSPLSAELIGLGVGLIVVTLEPAVRAVQAMSPTIPVVMAAASRDPVGAGFVASLARPGRNITGVTLGDIAGKRVELLRDAVPGLRSVAAFHADLNFPINAEWLRATEAAARRLGLALHPLRLPVDPGQWEQAFQTVSQRRIGAVTIHENPRWETNRQLLADLALKHRLPMVFTFRSQAEAGGLMSYAPDLEEIFRRAGSLAARILQGAKPADLPVEEPTKYPLVINLKTVKALGLTIPPAVLARADEIIHP
jgi:putative ABC transport system substrate-binding protein